MVNLFFDWLLETMKVADRNHHKISLTYHYFIWKTVRNRAFGQIIPERFSGDFIIELTVLHPGLFTNKFVGGQPRPESVRDRDKG